MALDREQLERETTVKSALSSKKGGQHVNKVSTQAQLFFSIPDSEMFSEEEKERLQKKLASSLTNEGVLIVTSQESRSLLTNKDKAFDKLYALLEKGLKVPVRRKKTKVPKAVVRKRLENKKRRSKLKENRRPPEN